MFRIVFKTIISIIALFAIAFGILLCIPSTRNFFLDAFARHSQLYQDAISENEDITDTYVQNLTLLTDMRLKLKDEEMKIVSYQTQLTQKQETLTETQNELATISNNLDEANTTIRNLNNEIALKNSQIDDLTRQLNEERAKSEQDIVLINALNTQIDILSGDVDENQSTIEELNSLKLSYETEIASLNDAVLYYQQECEALREQIAEQQEIINNLNEEIYYLANRSLNLSFETLNSICLVDDNNNIVFTYSNNGVNKVALANLIDLDIYNLHVSNFDGRCYSYNYQDGTHRVEGQLTVRPEETAMSVFLWDPVNQRYIDFNNTNINYLMSLGYTHVSYSIYAVEYSNGVVSFHFNFNRFS